MAKQVAISPKKRTAAAQIKAKANKQKTGDHTLTGVGEKGKKVEKGKQVTTSPHPFDWDPADDCETSIQAYRDIAPVLKKLASKLGKTKEELRIYDPYYCQGGVAKHLNKLGFPLVHNQNEDFYAKLDAGELPPHDVLMTSPPYSATHVKRLLEHVGQSKVAWILLLPDYVHRKQYYDALVAHQSPFFLLPRKSYQYMCVSGSRAANTDVPCRHFARAGACPKGDACMFLHEGPASSASPANGKKRKREEKPGVNDQPTPVTPFFSFWHVHFGAGKANDAAAQWYRQKYSKAEQTSQKSPKGKAKKGGQGNNCALARTLEAAEEHCRAHAK